MFKKPILNYGLTTALSCSRSFAANFSNTMNNKLLLIFLLSGWMGFAQKATVTGTIYDNESPGATLPFANITIKGTTIGVTTDENGSYTLKLDAGTHQLEYSFVGYETVEQTVQVLAGETLTINQTLGAGSYTIQDVVVQQQANREKESALLIEQKNAVEIRQSIGAQEMSRKGASDAQSAVTKVTGVSKQQGEKNVFVRGLGDRYNQTTMNGLPLPSEDPEYKNISLEFFTADIIKSIGVNKTFLPNLYGDVGGASIDILSKELSGNQGVEIGLSSGINSRTAGQKNFLLMDGANWFGSVPNKGSGINNLNSYSFENSLKPNRQSLQINSGLNASYGRKFSIGESSLSAFVVGQISNGYNFMEGTIRQTTSVGSIFQDQAFERYTYNVSQTLMGNFKYRFGQNSISLNSLYIHDNNQSIGDYFGMNDPQETDDKEFLRRQQQNNNNLLVNQLIADLKLDDQLDLNIGAAFNRVTGDEPDRRSNKYLYRDDKYYPSVNSAGENERYFSELVENDIASNIVVSFHLDKDRVKKSRIDLGYNGRFTTRDFEAMIFNHRFSTLFEIDPNNPDAIFNQQSIDDGLFQLQTGRGNASNPRVFDPFTYNAERMVHAGLASITYEFNPALTVVAGVRFEKIDQEISYDTNIASSNLNGKAKINEAYVLPSFSVKYNLNENSIFRAAAAMSYTMPQFKEVAPFKYQDVSFSSQGNPGLIPSDTYNVDLKWEYYPEQDEILAVTGYFKHINNPIARSEIPSGGNTLTYLNVGGQAQVMGAELEVRKNLYKVEIPDTQKVTSLQAGANVSYLYSKQQLEDRLPQFTNGEDQLQGASPWLVNADVTFRKSNEKYGNTSSLVVNYFSDRIYSVGTRGFENVVEKGIPTLDFVSITKLGNHFEVSIKAKNLLDPSFRLTRESAGNSGEDVTLLTYKRGVDFSIGMTYKF